MVQQTMIYQILKEAKAVNKPSFTNLKMFNTVATQPKKIASG